MHALINSFLTVAIFFLREAVALTKVLDADDSTALKLWGFELERVELVVAVDDGQIGV